MGLLEGKVALVFGVANKNSIAWGITQAFHREGAKLGLSYAGEALERRVVPLAETLGVDFVVQCNVNSDEELDATFAKIKERFGRVDVLVHSIAYATREDLDGLFVDTSRQGFITALETSAYSLVALTKRAVPLMPDGGSVMTLSYYGAEKVLPHYNVMGVAKSALESSVRYLAADLGPKKIRVNAISAGPIKTLSAAGIAGFRKMYRLAEDVAPLRELVSQDDVGDVAAWLGSSLSRMVTGETIYVDAGLSILGMPMTEEDL
ncbi:MAG: enoyl-[acyl-carrier-protein] reductase [NADH] [Chloroflexota bacterium]|nr:enoyl-ACP reductase [Chloroflexota bacterium]NOG62991.1 enoyl-ACP reductase [Chloroflexota bacterium]GIK62800.1 MAG: enoyl-[acyl-carrier-protein] reductase [NADH] [Chloroflexota bacterium]